MAFEIPFNKPPVIGTEMQYLEKVFAADKFSGDGPFNRRCQQWIRDSLDCDKVLTTPSCTAALEMCAILLEIKPGDEVIMPSFTFVSTANAFVLRGAKIIFVDIRQDTLNIDESKIEAAITPNTKAICVVHYAGVGCGMSEIMAIAQRHNIYVVEDAAQALAASYKDRPLGSIGHLSTFSFHETKNFSCGEGGALAINDSSFSDRAAIIQEKGTNRTAFFEGRVDKYTWVDIGSSYLLGELQAAYLMAQLDSKNKIIEDRRKSWAFYQNALTELETAGKIELPKIPSHCDHNSHIFHIRVENIHERRALLSHCKSRGISLVFHYIPLHSATAGLKFGEFHGEDQFTTKESERLARLPLFYAMSEVERTRVIDSIKEFF